MMNDPNQVINAGPLAIVPAKRKRGRPRKYPVLDDSNPFQVDRSPSNGGSDFHFPPSHRASNGKKSRHVDSRDSPRDGMTGQAVSGFLESEFDGGYLVTVRVRNSDIVLRGVVFKPGGFVPVSAENDVAPNVRMIKRDNTTFRKESYGRVHGGSHSRSRERNNGVAYPSGSSPSAGSELMKSKIMSPAPLQAVSSVPSRGNLVPVVLQPVNAAENGASVGNQDSLDKSQPVALQVVHPAVQSAPSEEQTSKNNQSGPRDEPSKDVFDEVETKPMITPPPGMPFENLVTEVIKRTQTETPSKADDTESSRAVGKSSIAPEDVSGTQEQHSMPIEPTQTVQPIPMDLSPSVLKSPESERAGKMTELLQAVQENAMKNKMPES